MNVILRFFKINGVGADVLSNAARFTCGHISLRNCVKQRGLAVVGP